MAVVVFIAFVIVAVWFISEVVKLTHERNLYSLNKLLEPKKVIKTGIKIKVKAKRVKAIKKASRAALRKIAKLD